MGFLIDVFISIDCEIVDVTMEHYTLLSISIKTDLQHKCTVQSNDLWDCLMHLAIVLYTCSIKQLLIIRVLSCVVLLRTVIKTRLEISSKSVICFDFSMKNVSCL